MNAAVSAGVCESFITRPEHRPRSTKKSRFDGVWYASPIGAPYIAAVFSRHSVVGRVDLILERSGHGRIASVPLSALRVLHLEHAQCLFIAHTPLQTEHGELVLVNHGTSAKHEPIDARVAQSDQQALCGGKCDVCRHHARVLEEAEQRVQLRTTVHVARGQVALDNVRMVMARVVQREEDGRVVPVAKASSCATIHGAALGFVRHHPLPVQHVRAPTAVEHVQRLLKFKERRVALLRQHSLMTNSLHAQALQRKVGHVILDARAGGDEVLEQRRQQVEAQLERGAPVDERQLVDDSVQHFLHLHARAPAASQ